MGSNSFLKGSKSPFDLGRSIKYKAEFRRQHPEYFDPEGLMVFCGPQGSGKTLSAVDYCRQIVEEYPDCIFVTNVDIKGLPEGRDIRPYNGMESLSKTENGYAGVLYLIDEIHLEFNSLESKNISIEEMVEFSQQRKQRKHIVGTSQVFMRLAKPMREQIKNVVLCHNYFGLIQRNWLIDGTTAREEQGKLVCEIKGKYFWFHRPDLYRSYDTYAKMGRYKEEWNNRKVAPSALPYDGAFNINVAGDGGSGRKRGRK